MINLTTSIYAIYNERFKAFLQGQTSKDKPTPLFEMKTYSFYAATCHLFYT